MEKTHKRKRLDLEFAKEIVDYFNNHDTTVRKTAKHFGISKSCVYHYLP